MKTVSKIVMASVAAIMCTFTTSCSKEETYSEKKLVKFVNKTSTYTFNYDEKGKLSKATEESRDNNGTRSLTYQYSWGKDLITIDYNYIEIHGDEVYESDYTYSLVLKNGLVTNKSNVYNEYNTPFSYDSSNRFAKCEKTKTTFSATWNGDKITSMIKDWGDRVDTYTYDYEGISCAKGHSPILAHTMNLDIIFLAHPEIGGMHTTQLPSWLDIQQRSGNSNGNNRKSTYSYEFDEEGYLTQIKIDDQDIYTFTWE